MAMYEFYQIFGQLVFLLGISVLALLSITLVLGKLLIKENRLVFPRLLLFTIDMFYGIFKRFSEIVGVDAKIVDQIGIEVRNKLNERIFHKIKPEEKILVLPHCLRHQDCEAKLGESGLVCQDCNRCVIGVLKNKAEEMGYGVYIIPGSTFLKNIVAKNNFKAFVGVACYQDLNLSMMKLSKFHCQGVPLLRDGCINTKVDVKAVLKMMGADIKNGSEKLSEGSPCSKNPSRKSL
ncbi:DUF116 domain-containing protein [Methanobacterium aggregans]|uniref:DUF116 domain-containing protein n=1 Tax=Methanobacterium aggregans TaxID=1615586 RepID=UPI001AE4EA12|nr:DUF116 domain-containing protein [Methanobacterium aggregans]MBP2045613.1 hypothetical protein [Methanobacterium aggregans]